MSYVILQKNNKKVLGRIASSRELTTAEKATKEKRELATSFTGAVYIGGTATVAGGKVTAITNPNSLSTVQQRRAIVKSWLREAEKQPIANWAIREEQKAKNVWNWLEMIAAASSVNGNLSNNSRWNIIQSEMEWGILKWYNKHTSVWDGLTSFGTFYSTNTTTGGWRSQSSISMPNSWNSMANYLNS